MDLDRLRFSPDGTKLLAQDESTVFVMNVDASKPDPLKVEFKIPAEDALAARFSPDSKRVVFTTQGLHTEEWSIEQKKLLHAHEPLSKNNCVQAKLSPDGRTIACMVWDPDSYWMDLSLLDSDSGQVLWQKKNFFQPSNFFVWAMVLLGENEGAGDLVPSSFSPDGNYLLIGPDDNKVAFDLRTRTQVKIGGALLHKATGAYAFLGNDRVAGVNRLNPKDSGIFSFPDGKELKKAELPVLTMVGVSAMDGSSYVLTDGFKDYEVSLTNVDTSTIVLGSETAALDLWGGMLATENRDGRIWVGKLKDDKFQRIGTVQPPESELAELYSVALSPDGKYLAVSTRTRGGLWNLTTGNRIMLLRGFHAAWNGDDLLMEFSKKDKQDALLVDASMKTMHAAKTSYAIGDMHVQYGMLTEWKDSGKHAKDLIVHRMSDGSELWRRTFSDGIPYYTASWGWKDLLFSFQLDTGYAKSQIKADAALANEAKAVKKKEAGRLIEVVDAATGKTLTSVVVEVSYAYAGTYGLSRVGDLLYATTEDNRTQVFSLTNGRELRELFGRVWAEDVDTGRVCINNRADEAIVYDADGKELAHLHVGSPLRFASFVENGQKVLLLGADQVVRIVAIGSTPLPMSVASAN